MKPACGHQGFILVSVLVITMVGLLFGAGALLLFRYQCQQRIDRQHEMEKLYAVRSTLNYIRTYTGDIPDEGKKFVYRTASERNLGLIVKPVVPIFPDLTKNHFAMENGHFATNSVQWNSTLDYEYGALSNGIPVVNSSLPIRNKDNDERFGLIFNDVVSTNNVKWWVNIGMRDTGGWMQDDYGRRYFFQPLDYVVREGIKATNDIMRLCIIRNVTNQSNSVGCRHGWPLSQPGERALVFEIRKMDKSGEDKNAEMLLSEYECLGGIGNVRAMILDCWTNQPSLHRVGLQVADDNATAFYIGNAKVNDDKDVSQSSRGYTFLDSKNKMSKKVCDYFRGEVNIGGITYPGMVTNQIGEVRAPELRAVFEVERKAGGMLNTGSLDCLTDFKVTPAYQYDVFLEHPTMVTNRATVAQKIGNYSRSGLGYTIVTYDTHGTDHKGFRRDEREQERRRSR